MLISATVKTHKNLPAAEFDLKFSSTEEEAATNNDTNFYSVLADVHEELVSWSDIYINGYYSFGPA